MLLTPISNYSIYAHVSFTSASTLEHANSHLNILIRWNKFIFLYIKRNDCGQDEGNVENFFSVFNFLSLSLSLSFDAFICAVNFNAADCFYCCCYCSSSVFKRAMYASTGFCGSCSNVVHWLLPTTELGYIQTLSCVLSFQRSSESNILIVLIPKSLKSHITKILTLHMCISVPTKSILTLKMHVENECVGYIAKFHRVLYAWETYANRVLMKQYDCDYGVNLSICALFSSLNWIR